MVSNLKKAVDFYCKAFGFELMGEVVMAGKVAIHAVLKHADSAIMLGGPTPDGSHKPPNYLKRKAQAFALYVYVEDVDAHHKRARRFKGIEISQPQDTFWGDRVYNVVDRAGHRWAFASRKSMPSREEMAAAMKEI